MNQVDPLTPLEELLLHLQNFPGDGEGWLSVAKRGPETIWSAGHTIIKGNRPYTSGYMGYSAREVLSKLDTNKTDRQYITDLFNRPTGGEE